jgi:8-oxo-dGTP pyrophosphatase MutT (NUDIX family)
MLKEHDRMQVQQRCLEKVTAFVTRTSGSRRELLVFRHPTAGVQLPAGTVNPNEAPEDAVSREVTEETGLSALLMRANLGKIEQVMGNTTRMIYRDSMLQSTPQQDATIMRAVLHRGLTVETGDPINGFIKVTFREINHDTGAIFNSQSGWIPVSSLAERVERHFYHLEVTQDTPNRWSHPADRGHLFDLYWVPLDSDPGLHPAQAGWLDFAREHGLK